MQTIAIPARVHLALRNRGFKTNKYGVVSWLENSPFHPRHWKLRRKAYDSAIICLLEFFMTLMSNAGSSITPEVGRDIGVGREVALICLTTTYLVGQGIGGLIFPPVAEAFGGRTIYVVSTMGYAVSCVVIAAAPRVEVVVCMRFLGGFLSAMPAVVAAGSIGMFCVSTFGRRWWCRWLTDGSL
jgi:MFS family permease